MNDDPFSKVFCFKVATHSLKCCNFIFQGCHVIFLYLLYYLEIIYCLSLNVFHIFSSEIRRKPPVVDKQISQAKLQPEHAYLRHCIKVVLYNCIQRYKYTGIQYHAGTKNRTH